MSMLSCAAAEPPTPSRSAAGKGRPGAASNAAQTSAARIDLSQCLICIVPLQVHAPGPRLGSADAIIILSDLRSYCSNVCGQRLAEPHFCQLTAICRGKRMGALILGGEARLG